MTWDGVRGTLQWMLLLVAAGIVVAVIGASRGWSAKDALLTAGVHEQLAKVFPNCDVEFESVRFADATHIEFLHLRMLLKGTRHQLLHVPRLVIAIDGAMLQSHRRIAVQEVTLHNLSLTAVRSFDNRWNWEEFVIKPPPDEGSPHLRIRNGTIDVGIQTLRGGPFRSVKCSGIEVTIDPEAHHRYLLDAKVETEAIGPVQLSGMLDTDRNEFDLQGRAGELRIGDPLLDVVSQFVPQLNEQLASIRRNNATLRASVNPDVGLRTASVGTSPDVRPVGAETVEGQFLRADADVSFTMKSAGPGSPLQYALSVELQNGRVSDMLLPVPLSNIEGKIHVSPEKIEFENLSAANGASTLFLDGTLLRSTAGWFPNLAVRATQMQLDERMRAFLPDSVRPFYDLLSPSGTFEVDVHLAQEPGQKLQVELKQFAAVNCRVVCDYFRVPVENIRGSVRQEGEAFEMQMQAQVDGHPISFGGRIAPWSSREKVRVTIKVPEMPVAPYLLNGLQRPELTEVRKTLADLNLTGIAKDVTVVVLCGAQTMNKVKVGVEGNLVDGTLNYTLFPYEITSLKGHLKHDPLVRDTWVFDQLEGRHGDAQFTGSGAFDLERGPGELNLDLALLQISLDHDLERAAVKASPSLESIWKDFGIRGVADAQQLEIHWSKATGTEVAVHKIQWKDGRLQAAAFPFTWENLTGILDWKDNKLSIRSLSGWHGETYFNISGSQPGSAYVELPRNGPIVWQLHLENFDIVKLNPDDEFKRALPPDIATALNAIDLRNPIELLRLKLDMKGWRGRQGQEDITAGWAGGVVLKNNTMNPGLELNDIHGLITILRGVWDGERFSMEGYADLDTLTVLDLPLRKVEGPIIIDGPRVAIGTPRFSRDPPIHEERNPYRQKTLHADLYGGKVDLDLDVALPQGDGPAVYQLECNLTNVELAEWAAQQRPPVRSVMGKVTARVSASGRGDSGTATVGQGWVQIMPAALYELPVFAQIFAMQNFRGAANTAFNYADGEFNIQDGKFDFSRIQLWGDVFGLIGKGEVYYAGPNESQLQFDFYSIANNQTPILKPIIRYLSRDWIRVQVTGTVQDPRPRVEPRIGLLDAAFKDFMQAVEAGQQPRTSRVPPRIGSNAP